jgi:hypothetical protein
MGFELVYDYERGVVVNAETGEVVDEIYVASPVDGVGRSSVLEYTDRVHYAAFFERLPEDLWFAFQHALHFLKSRGISSIDSSALARAVRFAWRELCWRQLERPEKQRTAGAVASWVYMRLLGLYASAEELCRDFGLSRKACINAKKAIRNATAVFKADRRKVIASLVSRYPDPKSLQQH